MGFWDIAKGIGTRLYQATPFDNAYRFGEQLFAPVYGGKTDWGKAAKEFGIGALETGLLLSGAGAGIKAAQAAGTTGTRALAGAAVRGTFAPGRLPATAFRGGPLGGRLVRTAASLGGPLTPAGAAIAYGLNEYFGGNEPAGAERVITGTPATGGAVPTGTGGTLPTGAPVAPGVPGPVAGGTVAPALPGRGGLVGLSPEQIQALAMQERELQRQYDELLAQFGLQEAQGRRGEAAARSAARREAAGAGQDIATELASAGLDISPAAAIAAEEIVARERQAQEGAAVRGLAELLAEIESGRTQAAGQLRKGKTEVSRRRQEQQIANTLAEQARLYGMFGGF